MKQVEKWVVIFLLAGIANSISCKKEYSCENCKETNKPPISIAGSDQVITLPTDSVSLNGTASSDPDGKISAWLWKKISGPASFNIIKPSESTTKVKYLVAGTYQFELKVTDNGGLSAKDTVQIIVNNPTQPNRPPVANAGPDFTVNYDLQTCSFIPVTVSLIGSASKDPDGTITTYSWTQIGMPAFIFTNPKAVSTTLTNLPFSGTYTIVLKVTDNAGATNEDTMLLNVVGINRPTIPAQLVPFGILSQKRDFISTAAAGNKILFAGGSNAISGTPTSRVDIYDNISNTWTTAELSQPRSSMAVAVLGNKIFFGGGNNLSSRVDIYDVVSGIWSTAELSLGRGDLIAGVAGNKILFAGGVNQVTQFGDNVYTNRVDIYDASTNSWSIASLSEARGELTATAVGNKIYFAGGTTIATISDYSSTSRIDIYDAISGSWSTSSLSEAKGRHQALAINNKIYWAGGSTITGLYPYMSNRVEIRDVNTQIFSFACLFQPNSWYYGNVAVQKDNKIVFFTGNVDVQNKFDIYDYSTNTWSIGILNQNIAGAIISVNNTIYVAGDNGVSTLVWKLEF